MTKFGPFLVLDIIKSKQSQRMYKLQYEWTCAFYDYSLMPESKESVSFHFPKYIGYSHEVFVLLIFADFPTAIGLMFRA